MVTTTTRAPAANLERLLSSRTPTRFNEWLRVALKERRMSQRQLAVRSGVDHSSISRLIRGDRMPSLGTAMKLAQTIDPDGRDGANRWLATSVNPNAAARVEHALRADDQLSEADIREVMLSYLGVRQRRSGSPRRVTRIG